MSKFFIETPFDRLLIFDVNNARIDKIDFAQDKIGSPVTGQIKELMLDVFDKKDLSIFDYSMLNLDKTKKSYKLYDFLIKTKTGETHSYSESAKLVFGDKKYARACAMMLHTNPFAFLVPCHRIVAKNSIGGFAKGIELKIKILTWENAL